MKKNKNNSQGNNEIFKVTMIKASNSKNDKLVIKEDVNFLEYPTWIVSERSGLKTLVIENDNGTYELTTSADSLPTKFDKVVLEYALCKLNIITNGKFDSLELPSLEYDIAKAVFPNVKHLSKKDYDRVILALDRWTKTTIKFNGVFFDGKEHITAIFHIIEALIFDDETKKLKYMRFSPEYMLQHQMTNFYKLIDFNDRRKISSPVAFRLHEILIKNFEDRDIWKIHITKLIDKLMLTGNDRYPSHALPKIRKAVNDEINEVTSQRFDFSCDPKTGICTFKKLKPIKSDPPKQLPEAKEKEPELSEDLKKLIYLLPQELQLQKSVRALLNQFFKDMGYEYVRSNILYSIQNAKTNLKVYLKKALENDGGEEIRAKEQVKSIQETESKKSEEVQKQTEEAQRQKELEQRELERKARKAKYGNLPDQYEQLWQQTKTELTNNGITRQSLLTWIEPGFICNIEVNTITVNLPNQFMVSWHNKHYRTQLETILNNLTGNTNELKYTIN